MRKQIITGLMLTAVAIASTLGTAGLGGFISTSSAAEIRNAEQTSDMRGIRVTAILQEVPSTTGTWSIKVHMLTHTHALIGDLAGSTELIADGKKYQPLDWEGSPPGGHHRDGVLHFGAISPMPAELDLHIHLVGDPESPRHFRWSLK